LARVKRQTGVAAVFAVLAIVTAVWPSWIEFVFGIDPDGGSGALEQVLVIGFGVLALVVALLAHRSRRAARHAEAGAPAGQPRGAE
jgi:hypothetical protein